MHYNLKNFLNAKIYCIRNTITDDIFIGCTCQKLNQRMIEHRTYCRKQKIPKIRLYTFMREINDSEAFYIELIENYPCHHIHELKKRQDEIIKKLQPSLNIKINC